MTSTVLKAPTYLAVLVALIASPLSLEGQSDAAIRVFGTVVDRTTGTPLPTARVTIARVGVAEAEPSWFGGSDGNGRFRTTRIPLGVYQIKVELLSYSVVSRLTVFTEEGDLDFRVELVPVDFALAPIVVSAFRQTRLARTGFYDRAESGTGHFVTRREIEALHPIQMSDVLRRVPGVSVIPSQMGPSGLVRLRGRCEPQIVLDGTPMSNPVYIDSIVVPSQIEAVEVYHGATSPIQYTQMTTCGTVMIWTRNPGTPTMSTVSMKKFLGAIGFLVVAVISTN